MPPVAEAAPAEIAAPSGQAWHSDTAFEGVPTGDGRIMLADSLDWRETPLTLMAMIETTEGGHLGAQIAGRMDSFEKRDRNMDGKKLPDGVRSVYSQGVFDVGDYGTDIERMVEDLTLRGISVDLSIGEWAFWDPEKLEVIDPETATDEEWERAFMGDLDFAVVKGTILAATVCPTPAFADARIALAASGWVQGRRNVWRAGRQYALDHRIPEGTLMTTLTSSAAPMNLDTIEADGQVIGYVVARAPEGGVARVDYVSKNEFKMFGETLNASAALATATSYPRAPLMPDRSAFEVPEADGPQPLTLHDDGTITGHLCLWNTCHTGYLSGQFAECIKPPRSRIDYADFHNGYLPLADGDTLEVGRLTVGTGHADPHADRIAARAHYDHSGTVAAFVRAVDGKHGVWLSGATKSDATDEQIRDVLACPPSGDWRAYHGNLELQAALAVVVPGFPVARAQLALSASGAPMTLILPSNLTAASIPVTVHEHSPEVLHAAIEGTLDEFIQADDVDCGCA